MPLEPAARTRFYKDKRAGKVMGVCAGIADYTGLDVTVVRILMFLALWLSGGSILPVYLVAGWIADDKPRELSNDSPEDRRFWQQVRASPARTAPGPRRPRRRRASPPTRAPQVSTAPPPGHGVAGQGRSRARHLASATKAQTSSTSPNGHAPWRKP